MNTADWKRRNRWHLRPLFANAVTLLAVALAVAIRILLDPYLGDHVPFATFFVAVIVSGWVGGFRPALLATFLGFVCSVFYFVPPRFSLIPPSGHHLVGLGMYFVVCLAIAAFAHERQQRLTDAERLISIVDYSQDAIISQSLQGTIQSWNAAAERLFGYSAEQAVGQQISFLIPAEQAVEEVEIVRRLRMGEAIEQYDTVRLRRDGQPLQVSVTFSPIKDVDGRMIAVSQTLRDITARKWLEQRFRATVESAPTAIVMIDRAGLMVLVNVETEKLFGYPRAELLGQSVEVLVPERFRGQHPQHRDGYFALPTARRMGAGRDLFGLRKDGSEFPVEIGLNPVETEEGLCVLSAIVDISARKDADAALHEMDRRRRLIVEASLDAIVAMDTNGEVRDWNPQAEVIFGWKREEALGRKVAELLLPERFREAHRQGLRKFLATGEGPALNQRLELTALHRNGREFPVELSIHPLQVASGWLFSAFLRDITSRKRAEDALHESEERYRAAIEAVSELIWTNNADGLMEGEQPGWGNFTGQSHDEYQGYGWSNAVHPEDAQPTIDEWNLARTEKRTFAFEHRVRRHDGEWRLCSIRAVPVLNVDGMIREWVGVHVDITERRRAEIQLRQYAAEVSEADRRKDEFLATLAHELRNPLAPVSNALQVIRLSDQLTGETAELHELMERQVSHLIRLVDDLMEVSRISRGKIELRKQPVNLETIVQTAVESTQPRIDKSGHQLMVSLPPEPIVLDADPVRISQVVANLLANAAKYMERGGQIDLVVRREGDQAILSVRDHGLGIPSQLLPRVFEMFAQMDHTKHHTQGGLGIGLALAKRLVEMHGGRIEAHSEGLGKGSEFIVKLPISLQQTGERLPEATKNRPTPLPQRKILVVDDARDALLVLDKLLTVLGQQVCTAPDARTGLRAAKNDPPDIIISDIGMPEIDGYEFARRLRLEPTLKGAMLVALTGYGQFNDRERGTAAGFDHYLIKPVSIDALRNLLTTLPQRTTTASGGEHGEHL